MRGKHVSTPRGDSGTIPGAPISNLPQGRGDSGKTPGVSSRNRFANIHPKPIASTIEALKEEMTCLHTSGLSKDGKFQKASALFRDAAHLNESCTGVSVTKSENHKQVTISLSGNDSNGKTHSIHLKITIDNDDIHALLSMGTGVGYGELLFGGLDKSCGTSLNLLTDLATYSPEKKTMDLETVKHGHPQF